MANLCCSCPKCNPENPQGPHRTQRWKATKSMPGILAGTYTESIVIYNPELLAQYKERGYTITALESI